MSSGDPEKCSRASGFAVASVPIAGGFDLPQDLQLRLAASWPERGLYALQLGALALLLALGGQQARAALFEGKVKRQ